MTNVAIKIGKPKFWSTNYLLLTIPNKHLINSILCVTKKKKGKENAASKAGTVNVAAENQ